MQVIQTASLSEQIGDVIKQQILSGELRPEQRISVEELADQWGVSRSPIRDALKQLEMVGLVNVVPRRGVYVGKLDRRSFRNIFDLRIALECLAVVTATELIPEDKLIHMLQMYKEAERRLRDDNDREFMVEHDHLIHDLIIEYCDNPTLIQFMKNLQDMDSWARSTLVAYQPKAYEDALPEHLEIANALRKRDSEAARKLLYQHLANAFHRAYDNWNEEAATAT